MAESDTAGAGAPGEPKPRALTREDVPRILAEADREWEALSPEERAARKAESEKADQEAFEAAKQAARPTLDALQRLGGSVQKYAAEMLVSPLSGAAQAVTSPLCALAEPPRGIVESPASQKAFADLLASIEPANPIRPEDVRKAVADGVRDGIVAAGQNPTPPPPEPLTRPRFEDAHTEALLAALREAFPGFKPTDQWWSHVEHELKDAHHRSNPRGHRDFCDAYWNWSAEELVRHLEAEGRVKPLPKRRGKTVCERLRELHEKDPDFAETAPERELARKIGKNSPGCFSKSHYWNTVLKPARAEVRSRKRLAKAGQKLNAAIPSKAQARLENWDQREAVGRLQDEMDAVEILDRRLLELHKENPAFAEAATESEVAQRIGDLPEDCLVKSPYWQNVLKPRRDELQARARDSEIDGGH